MTDRAVRILAIACLAALLLAIAIYGPHVAIDDETRWLLIVGGND